MNRVAAGLNGVEIQRFPAYLGELNLLIQLGRLMAEIPDLAIPTLGILPMNTFYAQSGCAPRRRAQPASQADLLIPDEDRRERAFRVKNPAQSGEWFDAAVGNPPYIGEKAGAAIFAQTRERHPYWNRFSGHHIRLLLLVRHLGDLEAPSGRSVRVHHNRVLAQSDSALGRCETTWQRTVTLSGSSSFGHSNLFPDAPGQDSLIVIGQRVTSPDGEAAPVAPRRPYVSVYRGRRPRCGSAARGCARGHPADAEHIRG